MFKKISLSFIINGYKKRGERHRIINRYLDLCPFLIFLIFIMSFKLKGGKYMLKKISFMFVFLLVTVGVLTACGSSTNSDDKETISFLHWRGEDTDSFDEIIEDFEEENPDIEVDMQVYPSDEYETNLQSKLKGGETGDVFTMFPGSQFTAITEAEFAENLEDEDFVDKFSSDYLERGQKDDKQYGLPLQLVFNDPIYNKTMFDEYGIEPPKDWEGFLDVLETLKENGVEYPIVFPAADDGIGQFMNPMMMNNAPEEDIWEKVQEGERKVTEDWWVKTLSQFEELNDKGYFGEENPLGISKDSAGTIFSQEKAGMLAMGSYMMAQIQETNPDLEMGLLAPITVSEDDMEWEGIHTSTFLLGINSESDHKESAKKFIDFLTESENSSKYADDTGQMLTIEDTEYESEIVVNQEEWLDKDTRFNPSYTITNGDVQEAVEASIEDVLGGTSPEEAAEKTQQKIDQEVDD